MVKLANVYELKNQDKFHHYHPHSNPVNLAKQGVMMTEKAKGIYIYGDDNEKLIDGASGAWCANIGYGNQRLCEAAFESMKELSFDHVFGRRTNRWTAALSAKMATLTPDSFQHFFFSSTGSDAVETSIKMAWYYWRQLKQEKKRIILGRKHSYHGSTIFASSLTGIDMFHSSFGLPLPGVAHIESPYHYRYGCGRSQEEFGFEAAASLERKIKEIGAENIAAFIGEPIQATSCMIIPPYNYWQEIKRICELYDILLIVDEVVTGFGKTGSWFGFQSFDFEPDIFTMAKGFSSGYFPISSVAIGEKVSKVLQRCDESFIHGFTNCGHPVGSAVALENIAVIEDENLVEKVKNELGPHLKGRLKEFLKFPCVGEVRSMGIMGAIEIDVTNMGTDTLAANQALVTKIGEIAEKKGLITRQLGVIAFAFPLIITKAQIDDAISILKESIIEASV